jgi:hypothetical protein
MARSAKIILCGLLLIGGVKRTFAFSLLGPFETWQVEAIGYNIQAVDIGGPMNLGEEYRWNVPIVVFAFAPSFLDYFGEAGVRAVEQAVAIFNGLPPASQMSPTLSEFPLDTRRFNHTASALGLLDLKSYALSALMEALGLASPERYAWTIRARFVDAAGVPFYSTIIRNFDPVTFEPTPYVNGTLYTFRLAQTSVTPVVYEAVEQSVDRGLLDGSGQRGNGYSRGFRVNWARIILHRIDAG